MQLKSLLLSTAVIIGMSLCVMPASASDQVTSQSEDAYQQAQDSQMEPTTGDTEVMDEDAQPANEDTETVDENAEPEDNDMGTEDDYTGSAD